MTHHLASERAKGHKEDAGIPKEGAGQNVLKDGVQGAGETSKTKRAEMVRAGLLPKS